MGELVTLGMFIAGVVVLGVCFVPTLVAGHRQHANMVGIFLVNLFFGWTLVGWIVALVWALHKGAKRTPHESIRELQTMLSEGSISPEEFARKRQQILDGL